MRLLSFIPGALMFLLLPLGSMAKKTRQGSSGMLETLQADGDFGILVQAALSAGLGGYLNQLEGVPVTLFAPDDSAFAKLPNGTVTFLLWPENNQVLFELLAYHSVASQLMSDQLITFSYTTLASLLDADNVDTLNVVIDSPGDGDKDDAIITLTNGNTTAKVVQADLLSSQGVAHQIDSVLVPSFVTLPDKDLVDTAIANNFTMLVAALQAAGLADTLRGTGPYTVYAPIDSAFDLLDIPALLENTEILSELLQYHVQAGTNYKAGMVDGLPFTMLQGDNVTITVLEDGSAMNKFRLMDQDKYMVNDATITDTDIVTLNGIIHVINKVLIPPDLDLSCCLATREFLLEEDTKIDIQCFPTPSLSSQCDWGDDGGFPGWTDGLGAIGIDGFTFFNSNGNLTLMADSSISTNALVECSANCVCFVQQTGLPCLKSGETRAPTDAPTNAPILPTESPVLFPTDVILDEGVAICNICGDGKEITNPDGIIQISNQPDQTCMALDIAGQAGLISDPQCLAYSLITQDTCGCTLTPVPTLIPVLPPTDQPLSAAPSSIGSSAPTTSAPTQGSVTSDPSFTRSPTNLPTGNPTFKPPTDLPGPTSPPTLGAPTPLLGLLETLEAEGEFTSLLQAAEATNLGALLPKTPITLFAPTDDAFAALPTGYWDYLLWPENVPILLGGLAYHAVNGDFPAASLGDRQVLDTFGSLFDPIDNSATLKIGLSDIGVRVEGSVNDVNVIKADIFYTTGTIHKIDGVLVADYLQAAIPPNDLVDTAIANNFTILVAAIQAAGLENTLRVPNGPFTVFAPTDQAFAALPKDILAALLLPENQPILYDILLYHVAANNTYAKDLDNGVNITTLLGEDRPQLPVTKDGDIVMVANATVIKHDVVTLNGIIHVIDTVLLPTDLELPTLPNPYCPICGDGKYVNNSDGIVDIPEVGNQSCAELEQSSLAGLIPAESCPLLQQLTQAPCDCQEVDILTPTPVPTMTPTTSSTEEEIAYCGDCHCIPGANETCPANKPQTDFSDLFDTYEGLTLENPHILTCNPFQDDDECETVPPLENGEACVVELVALREDGTSTTCPDRSYRLVTVKKMKDVDPSYQYLSHEGSCGTCSSLQDLTVYLKNPDLSSVGIQCGFQAIQDVQAGIDCFMEVGFTEACAAIWTYNTLATSAECGDLCVPFATEGEPNNGPPPTCALAECLQCDEDKVGPTFKEFAGRTRRNSGLLSAIARPCDTIASIQHMDPCLPNQAKPPAELIGEGIGDGKSASVLYGFCAKGILSADGSIEMTLNSGGFCGQVDVEQIPTRKLFDGETAISSVTGWECMECTGTYDVFGLKDGTGYSEKFENHEEMKTSCGKLTVEFDGMGGTQCILFKTSLLKESLTTRRNLRNKNLELDVSGYLLVNTLTFGPRTPTGDPSCPADIVFDRNQFKWVENAALTLQLVMQEPGTLIDPSNWECNSSQ